jgi:outer membrane protein TolC
LRAGAALLAGLLPGCVSYQPEPLQPERSAVQFEQRRLDDSGLRDRVLPLLAPVEATWPPPAWNRAQLLAVALVWNPKLAVARAQVGEALAHEGAAVQRPNPQLTLQSEYARHDPHPWLYGIALDLLLVSDERVQVDRELARLETSGARWDLMEQAWSVRSALLAALSDREAAARRLDLLARLATSQDRLVALERQLVAAGAESTSVLLAASQARIEIEQQQAQARAEIMTADAALAATLGVAPDALDGLKVEWPDWGRPPDPAADAIGAAREQALRSRSDLSGALDAYAAAENRLHREVLRQYPQIHLQPGYYWDHGIAKFPFYVAFDPPLFNRNEGAIAEARAARDVAGERMLALQAGIIGGIDAAARSEQVARDGAAAAERGLESVRTQRRNAATSLRLGAIAAGEDLGAEILALRSELEALRMRAQWQATRNALEDALRAPLSGPELQFSKPLPVAVAGAAR